LSMKKLGTPTGAGPGIDNENVGFVAAGTPLPVGRLDFFFDFDLDFDLDLDLDLDLWVLDRFSDFDFVLGDC
jgi:hypothetical protein